MLSLLACLESTYYRPQTKLAKVMFSQVSVCPQGGLPDRDPRTETPLDRNPLDRDLTAPDWYLNQAFLIIRAMGSSGGRSRWVRSVDLRQLMWWLNSPWAPGHICRVSVMIMFVVVLLFLVLVQGLTKASDQSRTLEDRNDSNNSLEVYTPNSFIHLFYNSPYMDVVDMHNILIIPSDSVLWEKTMGTSYLVGSFPCQFDFQSVLDIPVWDGVWEQATFGHLCPFR